MSAPALTIIESPYAGAIAANLAYARLALRDSILRGEVPFASHLLYTQFGVLNDLDPAERDQGINIGKRFYAFAERCAVYADQGISSGMTSGIAEATRLGVPIVYRYLFATPGTPIEEKEPRDTQTR